VIVFHKNKIVGYILQMAGAIAYGWAFWNWSGCWWFAYFILMGLATIDVAFKMRNSGNQWLHLLPGTHNSIGYILPMCIVVFDLPVRHMSAFAMMLLCTLYLVLAVTTTMLIVRVGPSYNLFHNSTSFPEVGSPLVVEILGIQALVASQLLLNFETLGSGLAVAALLVALSCGALVSSRVKT